MRPPADTNECLRVLRPRTSSGNLLSSNAGASSGPTSDYLIPLTGNHRSSTSDLAGSSAGGDGPEQCGYWETSFTREGVKAIARGEPVPTPEANGSVGNLSLGDLRSGSGSSRRRRSKGYATVPTFEAPTLSQSQSSQPLLGTPQRATGCFHIMSPIIRQCPHRQCFRRKHSVTRNSAIESRTRCQAERN